MSWSSKQILTMFVSYSTEKKKKKKKLFPKLQIKMSCYIVHMTYMTSSRRFLISSWSSKQIWPMLFFLFVWNLKKDFSETTCPNELCIVPMTNVMSSIKSPHLILFQWKEHGDHGQILYQNLSQCMHELTSPIIHSHM